jgi:sec-independent protein translocase protein TatB
MFDFSWSEILVIGIVALIVIGPKELPGVLRTLGQWMGKVRRMASDFQNQFQDAIREAELADIKKEVDDMAAQATRHFDPLDPLDPLRKEMDNTQREIESALAGTPGAESKSATAPVAASAPAGEAPTAPPPEPEAAVAEPTTARENVPVAPSEEPKPAPEHAAGGGDRP